MNMHDMFKSLAFCIAAAIAAAVPSYLLILYWGGFTYRGFLNMDVFLLTMILTGVFALRSRALKITGALLCAGGIGISILFDIQNLCRQSPPFDVYLASLPITETIAGAILGAALVSLCVYFASRAKPIKWDIAAAAILFVFILHCFVYSVKTSSPIVISPALQKLEFYSEAQMKLPETQTSKSGK